VGLVPARGLTYVRGGTYSDVERTFVARVKVLPKLVSAAFEALGGADPVNGVPGGIMYFQAAIPETSSRICAASSLTEAL
jgi:hypothetical protein